MLVIKYVYLYVGGIFACRRTEFSGLCYIGELHALLHAFLSTFTVFLIVLLWCCRFLRHVPVVYVDYPGQISLTQIYGTFNRAMLRLVPSLKPYAEPLTNAMVEFYLMSQVKINKGTIRSLAKL